MKEFKSTGLVRRIDDLGRVVIPKEIRRELNIHEGDTLTLSYDDQGVYFQKANAETVKDKLQDFSNSVTENESLSNEKKIVISELLKSIATLCND